MTKQNRTSTVVFACVATEEKLYLPYLRQLLLPNKLHILGEGQPWKNFSTKYRLLQSFLLQEWIDDDRIVCVLDAYDILPTRNVMHLQTQFRDFKRQHPGVKMVVGHDRNPNRLVEEVLSKPYFGTVNDGLRLNGGQFIGLKRDLKVIIDEVLETNPNFTDDQVELTAYAKQHPSYVWIDTESRFFKVCNEALAEVHHVNVPNTSSYSFVHANMNGFLNVYLWRYWGVEVPLNEQATIFTTNYKSFVKKIEGYVLLGCEMNKKWLVLLIAELVSTLPRTV